MKIEGVSIIVPNWDGRKLLEQSLPPLMEALESTVVQNEVILVDDGSTDDSIDFTRLHFPSIKIIALTPNRGFAYACNCGARESKYPILYFLNNDVVVKKGFLAPLFKWFERDDVFAVSSHQLAGDALHTDIYYLSWIKWRFGIFWSYYRRFLKEKIVTEAVCFSVSAGHSAYNKEKFLSLNGFDELYAPFYWEDVDICWRAWKRGWKSLYEPASEIFHYGQSTIGRKFAQSRIKAIHWRNRFLFTWKNLKDIPLWLEHLLWLPLSLSCAPIFGRPYFLLGFLYALGHLMEVREKRIKEKGIKEKGLLPDRNILKIFEGNNRE